ncbi:hypothetical protein [Phocaeicola sartorii]|uniref:hypothetical protein n=1 Tax=Phocaeicola sartorii TaxID=671267 RepID=UPI002588C621|nr:hypothetical protein [Phocaeicola sartorii]
MIGWIIWLVGMILTLKAAYEIWLLNVPMIKRIIAIILIFVTSWVGLLFYYLFARKRLQSWLS